MSVITYSTANSQVKASVDLIKYNYYNTTTKNFEGPCLFKKIKLQPTFYRLRLDPSFFPLITGEVQCVNPVS